MVSTYVLSQGRANTKSVCIQYIGMYILYVGVCVVCVRARVHVCVDKHYKPRTRPVRRGLHGVIGPGGWGQRPRRETA